MGGVPEVGDSRRPDNHDQDALCRTFALLFLAVAALTPLRAFAETPSPAVDSSQQQLIKNLERKVESLERQLVEFKIRGTTESRQQDDRVQLEVLQSTYEATVKRMESNSAALNTTVTGWIAVLTLAFTLAGVFGFGALKGVLERRLSRLVDEKGESLVEKVVCPMAQAKLNDWDKRFADLLDSAERATRGR